jgi:hypothetical protein
MRTSTIQCSSCSNVKTLNPKPWPMLCTPVSSLSWSAKGTWQGGNSETIGRREVRTWIEGEEDTLLEMDDKHPKLGSGQGTARV